MSNVEYSLDTILNEWDEDSKFDHTDIIAMTELTPRLHSKYLRIYTFESLRLKKLEADLKIMNLDKFEFLTMGPNEISQRKGWKLPPKGKVMKAEAHMYMDADRELINLKLRIEIRKQKVEALKEIIDAVNKRSFLINHVIQWSQWTGGK